MVLPYAELPNNFIVSAINSKSLLTSPARLASETSSANFLKHLSPLYLIKR